MKRNKDGRIVSKRQSAAGSNSYARNLGLQAWHKGVSKARQELGLQRFVAVKKGTTLYTLAKKYQAEFLPGLEAPVQGQGEKE